MENFRNLFRIGFLSFLIGGCCTGTADIVMNGHDVNHVQPPEIQRKVAIEKLLRSTIAIIDDDGTIKLPVCTGVWISKNLIVTAAHCVDDDKLVFDYATADDYKAQKSHKSTLVGIDKDTDLALLYAPREDEHPVVSFSKELIYPGDPVDLVGHPIGYDWTYMKGHVSAIRLNMKGPNDKIDKVVQISAPVWMGNSGGAAFDAAGNLVGICSWINKSGPQLSFFIHKDVVEEFLIKQLSKH